jgi:hypothetical protein
MNDEKIPELLYHVSPECVYESISEQGLKANFGAVFLSPSVEEALGFMWFRLLDHTHPNPESPVGIELAHHDRIDIWVVDTSELESKNLEVSTDHNPMFFGSAWVHLGDIPPTAIIEHDSITKEKLLAGVDN